MVRSYTGNIVPEDGTIFVFGSNPMGHHAGGSARVALEKFGARLGCGEGLQGSSYALPTTDLCSRRLPSMSKNRIKSHIRKMYSCARCFPNLDFKVAYRNGMDQATICGYTGREMMRMFKTATKYIPKNVVFSKEWVEHWND